MRDYLVHLLTMLLAMVATFFMCERKIIILIFLYIFTFLLFFLIFLQSWYTTNNAKKATRCKPMIANYICYEVFCVFKKREQLYFFVLFLFLFFNIIFINNQGIQRKKRVKLNIHCYSYQLKDILAYERAWFDSEILSNWRRNLAFVS